MPNKRTPSTTVVWEWAKIPRRRQPPGARRPQDSSGSALTQWPRGEKVTLLVQRIPSSEGLVLVRARGRSVICPGWLTLLDLVLDVEDEGWGLRGQPGAKRRGASASS